MQFFTQSLASCKYVSHINFSFIVIINNTDVTVYTHKALFCVFYENICQIKNILMNVYSQYCSLWFPHPFHADARTVLSIRPCPLFQILLAICDHLFVLFDSEMSMFDTESLINSEFKHTFSSQNVVCVVHVCQVIVCKLVQHYARTYTVNLYLHLDMFWW